MGDITVVLSIVNRAGGHPVILGVSDILDRSDVRAYWTSV